MLDRGYVARAIRERGGITINLAGEEPWFGYVVAMHGRTRKTNAGTFGSVSVDEYVIDNLGELARPGRYLGGWRDGADIELSVSRVFRTETEARDVAALQDQTWFFDVEYGRNIPVRIGELDAASRAH